MLLEKKVVETGWATTVCSLDLTSYDYYLRVSLKGMEEELVENIWRTFLGISCEEYLCVIIYLCVRL